MKPNWKQCAKHAYRLGRESARREPAAWIPARDPPKSQGAVFAIAVTEDGEPSVSITAAYFDGEHFDTGEAGIAVLFWTPFPPLPPGLSLG